MFPVSDFDSTVKRADDCSSSSSAGGDGHQSLKMYSAAAQLQMGTAATATAMSAVAMSGVAALAPEISTAPNHSGNSSSDAPSTPTPSMPTPAMAPMTSASLQTPSRRAAATDSNQFSSHSGGGGGDGPNSGSSSNSSTIRGQDVGESDGNLYAFQNYGEGDDKNDDDEVHSDNSEWFESNGNSKTKNGRRRRRKSFLNALRTAVLPTELVMVGAVCCQCCFCFCAPPSFFKCLILLFLCKRTRQKSKRRRL